MVNLREKPFYLDDEGVKWVEDTIASMTLDEKVGQLFVLLKHSPDMDHAIEILKNYYQGGVRWQGGDSNAVYAQNRRYQENTRIPLLIAANCDNGGDGCMPNGTFIATAAEAGAGKDTKTAYDMGYVAGREAASVGVNWMFNPCADIFMNWRNTIVNTRAFADNADEVIENVRAYINGIHQSNVAACCKHFPGDGVEERDQHLVLGVNDLSVEEWDNSFRKVYQTMIDEGLESIMVGHIALPEMSRKLRPGIKDEDIMPATLAPELLTDLLRNEMGFNGLVITDASHMAGIACMEKREIAVPKAIASGCDMFLFANNVEEDMGYMKAGIESGMITPERLDDALHRILGLKARLKLYKPENCLIDPAIKDEVVGCDEHKKLAEEAAKRCITLVKDTKNYLPIKPEEKKRAHLVFISSTPTTRAYTGDPVKQVVVEELEAAGFEVEVHPNFHDMEAKNGPNIMNTIKIMECGKMEDFRNNNDVVFLVLNIKGYAQENEVRLRWSSNHSSELPWYVTEVPTVGISLNYTTHLIDVPQVLCTPRGDSIGFKIKKA